MLNILDIIKKDDDRYCILVCSRAIQITQIFMTYTDKSIIEAENLDFHNVDTYIQNSFKHMLSLDFTHCEVFYVRRYATWGDVYL